MTRLNARRILSLNIGLGRDSTAELCLLAEGKLQAEIDGEVVTVRPEDVDYCVFSNTGCEWPHSYAQLERIESLCASIGVRFLILQKGPDTVVDDPMEPPTSWEQIEQRARRGLYHYRASVMKDYQSRATVAPFGSGDCTENHKLGPMRKLMNDVSLLRFGISTASGSWAAAIRRGERKPHVAMIGFAADEQGRLKKHKRRRVFCLETFPLITMGLTKADEAPVLERHDLGHVRKSGCYVCPYQHPSWWWALSVTEPDTWARVCEYERVALARNPKMACTGDTTKGAMPLPEVVMRWRTLNPHATVDAVLNKEYSRCDSEARKDLRGELTKLRRSK